MSDRPRRAALLLAAVTVLLAVGAAVLLAAGVEVRETTGGLLVTPYRQLHLVGGYLVAGTVAGVAAVLTGMSAVAALRRARRAPAVRPPGRDAAPPTVGADPGADPAHAASSPGSDRRE
ncbi:MAG: hypothetical protein K0S40_857 [Actinomycetospora sp.]|nr:hypothetical protein [Actinomycetospora sp.]